MNTVDYRYEHPYVHDVATPERSQYQPDFFYPQIDVWHEHWALDSDGNPPVEFDGYAEAMVWKRETHRQYGTTLVETTWAEILDASGFTPLEEELTSLGLTLDWNPDRVSQREPVRHEDLARLIRTFMTHVKSKGMSRPSWTSCGHGAGGVRTAPGSSWTCTGRSTTSGKSGCGPTTRSTSRTC